MQTVATTHYRSARIRGAPFRDDINATGGGEITVPNKVGSFGDFYMVDGLRYQPVKIGVSLAVSVIHYVDGNTIDVNGKVGSMICVETSEKILVRFPSSLVLHGVKTRNRAGKNIDRCGGGTELEVSLPNVCFSRRGDGLLAPDINLRRFRVKKALGFAESAIGWSPSFS